MYKLYLKENYDTSTRQETCCENLYIRSVGLSFEGMVTHLTFFVQFIYSLQYDGAQADDGMKKLYKNDSKMYGVLLNSKINITHTFQC